MRRGKDEKKRQRGVNMFKVFIPVHENRTMQPDEIILRRGGYEGEG
jgi:hypothetical protein